MDKLLKLSQKTLKDYEEFQKELNLLTELIVTKSHDINVYGKSKVSQNEIDDLRARKDALTLKFQEFIIDFNKSSIKEIGDVANLFRELNDLFQK